MNEEQKMKNKQPATLLHPILALLLFAAAILAYSNHFHNSFHFDDEHCIVNNAYIRNLHFFPQYFKTASTFSSLPMNQTYRPMLTALFAIDYHFGKLDVFYYHLPVFIFFMLTGILVYLVSLKLFNKSYPSPANSYFALFACGWYILSTANSDTINYISASSDSISTFWVMCGLAFFIYFPKLRKLMLYLLPVIIGSLFKQTAIVFPGLLAAYYIVFEVLPDTPSTSRFSISKPVALRIAAALLPSFLLCSALYVLQRELTPPTFVTGGVPLNYYITQPFAALTYFFTFFVPAGLTADSGWNVITSLYDYRLWTGMLFLFLAGATIVWLTGRKKYAPLIFGIAFFFIALLPTSLIPLSEAMNDHRSFFPNIGLAFASAWLLSLVWHKYKQCAVPVWCFTILVLICNAVATFERNKVWNNEESLWYDVTLKSPDNARGLLNYGRTQLIKANYAGAEEYFTKAVNLAPRYPYVYANIGVLKAREHKNSEADSCFRKAMLFGSNIPSIMNSYADFLHSTGNNAEAVVLLLKCINMSPADMESRHLAMQIYSEQKNWKSLAELARQTLYMLPGDEQAQNAIATAKRNYNTN